jgi:hypothetical protein
VPGVSLKTNDSELKEAAIIILKASGDSITWPYSMIDIKLVGIGDAIFLMNQTLPIHSK